MSRSASCSRAPLPAATCCSRTCRARPRRCSRARSPARSTVRLSRASSAPPTSSRPTSPGSRSATRSDARVRVPAGPVFANVAAGRRDQPRDAARPSRRCSRRWPSGRSRSTVRRTRCPTRSSSSRRENPIEQEGTFPLPEAQLDRFFLARRSAIRTRTRSCGSSRTSATATRSTRSRPVDRRRRPTRDAGSGRARLRRPDRPALARSSSSARRASSRSSTLGASVRARSRSSARRERGRSARPAVRRAGGRRAALRPRPRAPGAREPVPARSEQRRRARAPRPDAALHRARSAAGPHARGLRWKPSRASRC